MKKLMIVLFIFLFVTPVWAKPGDTYVIWHQLVTYKTMYGSPRIKPWKRYPDEFDSIKSCDKILHEHVQNMVTITKFLKKRDIKSMIEPSIGYAIVNITFTLEGSKLRMEYNCLPLDVDPR